MKLLKRVLLSTFVIFNLLVLIYPVLIYYAEYTQNDILKSIFNSSYLEYIPSFVFVCLILAALAAKRMSILLIFCSIASLPILGCCFVKKNLKIYRFLVYIVLIVSLLLDLNTLPNYRSLTSINPTTANLALAVIIDIVYSISRKKEFA